MFSDTMTRWIEGLVDAKNRYIHYNTLYPVFDRQTSRALQAAGTIISSGGAATAKTGAADTYLLVKGVLVKVAASTTLPALVGTITGGSYNVFCFFVDSAGVVTSAMGTEGTTIAKVVFPQFPKNKAIISFLLVTLATTFTGGTSALDGSTTTVYVDTPFGFDPACLTG